MRPNINIPALAAGPKKTKPKPNNDRLFQSSKKKMNRKDFVPIEDRSKDPEDFEIEELEQTVDILHRRLEKLSQLVAIKDRKIEILESRLYES